MDTFKLEPQSERTDKPEGDSYLNFYLNKDTPTVLSMAHAQEVLVVPVSRLTLMPNMPECVLGLLNRRNRVIWVVSLADVLNLPKPDPVAGQYHIVIVRVGQISIGFVVAEVKGVTRFPPDSIQSPSNNVESELAAYLHGCISQQNQTLLVLNAEAIVRSPHLKN